MHMILHTAQTEPILVSRCECPEAFRQMGRQGIAAEASAGTAGCSWIFALFVLGKLFLPTYITIAWKFLTSTCTSHNLALVRIFISPNERWTRITGACMNEATARMNSLLWCNTVVCKETPMSMETGQTSIEPSSWKQLLKCVLMTRQTHYKICRTCI